MALETFNHFEAPRTLGSGSSQTSPLPPRRSHWTALRWIPVITLLHFVLYNFVMTIGLGCFLVGFALDLIPNAHYVPDIKVYLVTVPVLAYLIAMSVLGWVAMRHWYRYRWRQALLTTVGYGLLCVPVGLLWLLYIGS